MNKTLKRGTREVIYKVYKRCLLEKEARIVTDLSQVLQRTAELTDKSLEEVRRIVQEGAQNNGKFSTRVLHRAGHPKKNLDDFDLCTIRQKIEHFNTVTKQVPTLRNLLTIVKEDLGFTGSREDLRKVIKALGFKFKSSRSALVEKNYIAAKREEYLKIIIANRNLPEGLRKEVIYLDEYVIDSSYKLKKCWQSIDIRDHGVKDSVPKDKRYIIVHAGSRKGFIPNALLIFSGTNKNEDSQMNQHNFTKWVKEKLIPNINKDSIVVMNNAPYHSVVRNRAPTTATKADDIKRWLINNNIQFDESLKKPQLLMLVKKNKPAPIYEIDELFSEQGHTVVRLPPCHCDLNPLELIWRIAKQKMASHKVGTIDVKAAAERAFRNISVEDWRKACERVIEIERGYYERGSTLYDEIDGLIINLQDDSSSDDSSESDDEMPRVAHANGSGMEFSEVEF